MFYGNRLSLGSRFQDHEMVPHPLKGQEKLWEPQQQEVCGMYVSIVFSFPVWLKQTNNIPAFDFFVKTQKIFFFRKRISL